ncbi:Transcription-associated protein 1 [Sphaceloma murrayae]|uniref:Transcription-associated protein 1 n=1 Tax=Sphaceloma murrayae TaxID=2082308 RepID=A0A2K1QXM2_9PEZI|nr:Transcription-associated protein 1 [Sphaceloma murrayae]
MGRPRKRRAVDEANVVQTPAPVAIDAEVPADASDTDHDGNYFEGRGIFSPLMPNVRTSPWPALDEVPSESLHVPSHALANASSVPELTESDSASSTNGSGHRSESIASTPGRERHNGPLQASLTATSCVCLSSMYLSLSSLQAMSDFSFPGSLHKLREAISCAWTVLHCPTCPTAYLTGFQNVQLLGMFMVSTAERYSKIVAAVDAEAEAAIATGRTKSFRMGDLQGSNSHLHSNDPNFCMAAISLDLDPRQWRTLVRRVIRGEIWGAAHVCCPAFMTLIDGMFARQDEWHRHAQITDFPRPFTEEERLQSKDPNTKKICLTMVYEAKKIIEHMSLD